MVLLSRRGCQEGYVQIRKVLSHGSGPGNGADGQLLDLEGQIRRTQQRHHHPCGTKECLPDDPHCPSSQLNLTKRTKKQQQHTFDTNMNNRVMTYDLLSLYYTTFRSIY